MTELQKIIVVGGPTGVGKTAFSLAAAKALDAEIVSIDSVQIYKGLDIGSAKASAQERAEVPHHLIDVLEPDQECNVADYLALSHAAIAEIHSRGKTVLCTGGTNLYMRVLVHGIFEAPAPDEALRQTHREIAKEQGVPHLHAQLADVDPTLADRVGANDLVRVSRGLEVFAQTGRRLSELQNEHRFATPQYDAIKLMFNRPRAELYDRINQRVDQMMTLGLLEEYQELAGRFDPQLKPLMSLGYRHMGLCLRGELSQEDAVELLKRDTRRFAKQQISWLRSEKNVTWALAPLMRDATIPDVVLDDLRTFLSQGLEATPAWASVDSNSLKEVP